MLPNPAIKNPSRRQDPSDPNVMSSGQEQHGMQVLNQSLASLVAQGTVTFEAACLRSNDTTDLKDKVGHLKTTEHIHVPAATQNNGRNDRSKIFA
jgi:Tfp pilus assembly pilus retraction ATPase PilT